MPLFSKHRHDGWRVHPTETYALLMPYLFRTRTESLVYLPMELDVGPARAFLRACRGRGEDITLFHLVAAAVARTVDEYPAFNRFVSGYRLYQRRQVSFSYTVKQAMTLTAAEGTASHTVPDGATVFQVAQAMQQNILPIKADASARHEGRIIAAFEHLPRPLLRAVVGFVRLCDYWDIMPAALQRAIPFYSTVFISNLGSMGQDAPYHHLYELGTCSIFLTMGRVKRVNELADDGTVVQKHMLQLRWTVDERITDGFYLSSGLKRFTCLMAHPEELARPPRRLDPG